MGVADAPVRAAFHHVPIFSRSHSPHTNTHTRARAEEMKSHGDERWVFVSDVSSSFKSNPNLTHLSRSKSSEFTASCDSTLYYEAVCCVLVDMFL